VTSLRTIWLNDALDLTLVFYAEAAP